MKAHFFSNLKPKFLKTFLKCNSLIKQYLDSFHYVWTIDTEFIGLKTSSYEFTFKYAYLLLNVEHKVIDYYHSKLKYNMYEHDRKRWYVTLHFM